MFLRELDCEIILKRDQRGATVVLKILIDLDCEKNLKRGQLGTTVVSGSCKILIMKLI